MGSNSVCFQPFTCAVVSLTNQWRSAAREHSRGLRSTGKQENGPNAARRRSEAAPSKILSRRNFGHSLYVRDLPRNLACLTTTAISVICCQPQFEYVPEANRHFAARPQEALDLLLAPPQQS